MKKSASIRFRRGRQSSLANSFQLKAAEEAEAEPDAELHAEFLDVTDESSEGVEEDNESYDIPAEVKLMFAAHEGDLKEIEELLAAGVDVNYRDIDDRTAMHVAACQGYQEVMELLIGHGAEVDAIDKWGSTPLADAVHYKNHGVAKLLENHGAAPPKRAPSLKNEANVPDYEIDPQEIDSAGDVHTAKGKLATWRGIEVSIKKIDDIVDEDRRTAFIDELALLQRVRHPNVVQFLGAVTQSNEKMIVTEFFPKGDLRQLLQEKGQLHPRTAVKFSLDIARGAGYLHEHKPEAIIHGALEPSNILRDTSETLKVAGFGMSKLLKAAKEADEDGTDESLLCHPGRYMAPELFRNEGFDTKVDVFSFALILQEMIEGCPPFSEKDGTEVAQAYVDKQRPPFRASGKLYPHGLKELIERCWSEDPEDRPTFREIIARLDKISHHIGHGRRWKIRESISKNLSSGVQLFKFHHRK